MSQHWDVSAYTVGWVCATKDEVTASRALLDEEHERPPKQPNDDNGYILGRMEKHYVAIAFPGAGTYGADVIAQTTAHMVRTFQNIRFGLMVGIGGGAPSKPDPRDPLSDIRLGDVAVSEPKGNHGGVLQYDKGQWKGEGLFEVRSHLNQPPKILLNAMKILQSDHDIGKGQMTQYFNDVSRNSSRLKTWGFQFPGRHIDRLFKTNHPHAGGQDCSTCGIKGLEKRLDRESDEPVVHYGLIASANSVMKSAVYRDHLRDAWGACCFEMEAAGLMNEFPCLIIRGIADYSDDHKNDLWQRYAAAVAATYAKDLLRVIQAGEVYHTELAAQIAQNLSQTLDGLGAGVANVSEMMEDDQTAKILNWLCPVDYGTEQSDFLDKRQQGTGQWLLNSDQFQHWYTKKGQTLLCQGIPGAGKTIMAATVNDYINTTQRQDSNVRIAYVFCNVRRRHQQKPIDLLASILKQLAQQDRRLTQELNSLHCRHSKMKTHPSKSEIFNALCGMDCDRQRTFVVIDALDEIQVPNRGLMVFLLDLLHVQEKTGLNLLATSRFIPEIENLFRQRGSNFMEIRAMDEDVRTYIQGNMLQLPSLFTENKVMVDTIKEKIVWAANGMFLLARLHLDSLQDKVSPNLMRHALEHLPRGSRAYEEAYREAMERIENQMTGFRNLAIQTLSWVVCAQRPLTTYELQHALAIKIGGPSFDRQDVVDVVLIVSVCAGLIAVDEKSNIIRLVHYTAQEFFDKFWKDWFPNAHREIADACTTYLSYDCIGSEDFASIISEYELYTYSAQNWGHHARLQSVDEKLVFRLLENEVQMSSCSQHLVLKHNCCDCHTLEGPKRITNLHLTAYFGLGEIAKEIERKGGDITANDNWGRSALSWAAEKGHREVVEILLDAGLDPNLVDDVDMTPPLWAVINGHGETAKLLLKRENEVSSEISAAQVELICEACMGHKQAVESLLDQGANPDCQLGDYTPLLLATTHGHISVAKLLLESGSNPDLKEDPYGRSSLFLASWNGHEEIVRLLLEYGAHVDGKDANDDTPLRIATGGGRETAVRLLLEFGADPDLKCNDHLFPLIEAARTGFDEIIKMLLEYGAGPDLQDANGGTALICAAVEGNEATIHVLLAYNPQLDLQDYKGSTALIWAVRNGLYDAVHALLDCGPNLNLQDEDGSTAIIWAAYHGFEKVVGLLLGHGADLDLQDKGGSTALTWAISEHHEATAHLLIQNGADPNKQDSNGGFALIWAVRCGLGSTISILLQNGADRDIQDANGGTALICAAVEERDSIVCLLLAYNPQLDLQDHMGSTALIWATRNGCYDAVHALLDCDPNLNLQDKDGRTALIWAAYYGFEKIITLLLEHGADLHVQDEQGKTALTYATREENVSTVQLLLAHRP